MRFLIIFSYEIGFVSIIVFSFITLLSQIYKVNESLYQLIENFPFLYINEINPGHDYRQ